LVDFLIKDVHVTLKKEIQHDLSGDYIRILTPRKQRALKLESYVARASAYSIGRHNTQNISSHIEANIIQLLNSDEVDMMFYGVIKPISTKADGHGRYWFDHSIIIISAESSVQ
jgi:hypothetical protein